MALRFIPLLNAFIMLVSSCPFVVSETKQEL